MFNAKLFLSEIVTALHVQALDGTFILKIYDISFEITRQLIMLLSSAYKSVKIVKPITSRPGNSEKYLLCEGFRGVSEEQLEDLKGVLQKWT
jgi:23S rRNA U2552 (ribose-2'-O)-methylase RlmE/FtsJ